MGEDKLYSALLQLHQSRINNPCMPAGFKDSIQILTESAYSKKSIRFIDPIIHYNNISLTKEELLTVLLSNGTWIVRKVDFTLVSESKYCHFNGPIFVMISNKDGTAVITVKCKFVKIM